MADAADITQDPATARAIRHHRRRPLALGLPESEEKVEGGLSSKRSMRVCEGAGVSWLPWAGRSGPPGGMPSTGHLYYARDRSQLANAERLFRSV